jgi:hypothetical protein
LLLLAVWLLLLLFAAVAVAGCCLTFSCSALLFAVAVCCLRDLLLFTFAVALFA